LRLGWFNLNASRSNPLFPDNGIRGTIIRSGLASYFAFDVPYDPDKGLLGLKPRLPVGNSPTGIVSPN
jgi:hypothetical protein